MELGKRIRQLRCKAGLTQEQLAGQLGIAPQSVSKWENAAAMPDITALPLLAEIFGVSIDDLFDLSVEQRLNRIENRMDVEEELPQDVFREYEDFLKAQTSAATYQKRATELLSYLYWHRMNAYAEKVRRYAREAIRRAPGEKGNYWELAQAERWLELYSALEGAHPVMKQVYRAYIALARFDEPTADGIIETMLTAQPDDSAALFEAAQYYAAKCDYDRAIDCYERAFAADPERPRFQDALMGIADIWLIKGDRVKAAETYGRIVDLLETEWGFTEEVELQTAKKEQARLLAK